MKIAEIEHRQINWGSSQQRNYQERDYFVVVKIGFMEFKVDQHVVGEKRLRALRDNFYKKDARLDPALLEATTPENRRDAAEAAIQADDADTAAWIAPDVLFDSIVVDVLTHVAGHMNYEVLAQLLSGVFTEMKRETESARLRGRDATKAELRKWLGVDRTYFDPDGDNP